MVTFMKKDLGWKGMKTEGMMVAIDGSRNERIIITNVYRLPVRRIEGEDKRVNDDMREWLEPNKNELNLGDFNLHAKEWSDGIDRRKMLYGGVVKMIIEY